MQVAVNRQGKRAKIKKKTSSAAGPARLSASNARQVSFTMTRKGMPSRFQSERRGKRETKSQMRRFSCGVGWSRMGSTVLMKPSSRLLHLTLPQAFVGKVDAG